MKNNIYVLLILSLLIISSFMVGRLTAERRSEGLETSDTVIISKRDTLWKDTIIEKTKYIPKKIVELRHDTITKDTVLTYEQKTYEDTIAFGNDSIVLSNTVTGVDARLDSTHVQWKKQKEIVTNYVYITNTVEKKKFITFSPQATAGYDPFANRFGVVCGFGIAINF